ncbi:MAG: UDP-N-acetylmuramoyl-L-alanine--D-glutamate ligase [Chitinophagia bacterium]|nr:UDP-N-acetylmuramoyl-L-alanine--D-glutamate ligase [Chitinophagia bacterium]
MVAHGILFEEGGHTMDRILNADCIVKSPGIPEKVAVMQQVRAAGIEVCSEIEFAWRYKGDSKVIAITGTNGKSTTTTLIYHMLKTAGYNTALVGNIGCSFARQIAEQPAEWYVAEVSSFQLDDTHQFRPDVAIILNITPDHLDRYHYNMDEYISSKFKITANQTATDVLILNRDDAAIHNYTTNHSIHAKILFFTMDFLNINGDGAFYKDDQLHIRLQGDDLSLPVDNLTIKGKHNQYNSMAAGITGRVANIRKDRIRESFESFNGLEHRLEFVAMVKGVEYINDSKGTNLNSVWYALESMKKPVVLILGGQDKGNDYNEILALVKEKVRAIVCMGADNTKIIQFFSGHVELMDDTHSMTEAVKSAYYFAEKGDAVLLSPGCASFDLFKNYEDRGHQFKEAVRNL